MTKKKKSKKKKRATKKKKARKVQKSIYWEADLVLRVEGDAERELRSFSDQLAWITKVHYQEAK